MKRKLSFIGSIVNTVSILAFGVMYGIVFWVLASIFLNIGGEQVVLPSALLFGAMILIVICLILNICMIATSVKNAEKYAKAKIGIIITAVFNVLLVAYIIYLTTTIENILVIVLLIALAILLLADTALYILDLVREKNKTTLSQPTPTATTDVATPQEKENNQQ